MTDDDYIPDPPPWTINDPDAPPFTQILPAAKLAGAWDLRTFCPTDRDEFYIGTFPRKADAIATAKGWRKSWHKRRLCWVWSLHG
jgi:hypothetical protein